MPAENEDKMKKIGSYILYVVMAFNLVVIVFLLLSAYSSYVDPVKHPVWACTGLVYIVFFVFNAVFLVFWLFAKPVYMLVPLIGIAVTWGSFRTVMPLNYRHETADSTLTVLSYNVMGFRWQFPDNDEKSNPILDYVVKTDADIVCFQEYILSDKDTHLREKDLLRRLKMYPYHKAVKVGGSDNKNKLACYSKYPIIGWERVDYESMYNGSIVFKLRIDGDTVIVINNHLESNKLTKADKDAYNSIMNANDADSVKNNVLTLARKLALAADKRKEQAIRVAEKIKEYDEYPVIVCGDFNDGPLSYAHRVINKGLTDAFTEAGFGLGTSYNQNKFYFRIDNILVNDFWKIYTCKVDNSIDESDHYPIISTMALVK